VTPARGRAGLGRDLRAALPGWIVARVLVAGALVVAHVVDEQFGPRAGGTYVHFIHLYVHQGLRAWDGAWYQRIAQHGYWPLPVSALRFFPLYPMTARVLALALGGNDLVALLVLANGGALVGAALLHRLALRETGDADLARRAAWLIAIAPPSFVLAMAYSEGLFLVLSVGVFLALRSERFGLAAVLGLLLGLTRPTGVLFAAPAAIEAVRGIRRLRVPELAQRAAAVVAPLVGCGAYLLWVGHVYGDAQLPLRIQQRATLRGPTKDPVSVVVGAVRDAASGHWGGNAAHLPALALLVVLAVVACRRWPAAYGALAVLTLVVAVSGTRIGSIERYTMLTFPFALALASVTARPMIERAAFALGAASLLAYGVMAFVGLAVP
jgi:hypothetical protein